MNGCIYKTADNRCRWFSNEKYTSWCDQSCPYSKPSNADHIRAMTDIELAKLLCDHACSLCPIRDCDGRMEVGKDACYNRWLEWLGQEFSDRLGGEE